MNTGTNAVDQTLPLAELHCHLEGTVRPGLARKLARRHGLDLSSVIDANGSYIWRDFAEFLSVYDAMSAVIRTPEDYIAVATDYYERAARSGLCYGEVFVSPAHAAQGGINYPTLIDALAVAFKDIEARYGTVCRIVLTAVRHLGAEEAEAVARLAARYPHPMVTGFGMAGDESFGQPADFTRAFRLAQDAGLGLTAHAGELAGPESIRATLAALPVTRLGHGVRAAEDPALLDELRDRGIGLELCPTSNLALCLFPSYAAHPAGAFFRAGLKLALNTDDAAFFGIDIAGEYRRTGAAHALSRADLLAITGSAIEMAFSDAATRTQLLAGLTMARAGPSP